MYRARVIIADKEKDFRHNLKEILRYNGYLVVGEAEEAQGLLQQAFQLSPDLIIIARDLPGNEGMYAVGIIEEHRLAPVVIVGFPGEDMMEVARLPGVYGVLTKPLQEEMVVPVLEMATAFFERMTRLEKEAKTLRRTLEERRLVERAKSLLVEKRGMTEKEAHRYLQKLSMDRCVPVGRVAKEIILKLGKEEG